MTRITTMEKHPFPSRRPASPYDSSDLLAESSLFILNPHVTGDVQWLDTDEPSGLPNKIPRAGLPFSLRTKELLRSLHFQENGNGPGLTFLAKSGSAHASASNSRTTASRSDSNSDSNSDSSSGSALRVSVLTSPAHQSRPETKKGTKPPDPFPHLPSFQNSSFLDDTRAQFDLDIDLAKVPVLKASGLPWRNFRKARDFSAKPVLAGTDTAAKIDSLTGELTGVKIQLRLYEKFLQDLLQTHALDIDMSAIPDLARPKVRVDADPRGSVSLTEFELLRDPPQQQLGGSGDPETTNLIEDLYASLEEYQAKWREADQRAASLTNTVENLKAEIAKVVDLDALGELDSPTEYLRKALPLLRPRQSLRSGETQSPERSSYRPRSSTLRTSPKLSGLSPSHGLKSPSRVALEAQIQDYESQMHQLEQQIQNLKIDSQDSMADRYALLQDDYDLLCRKYTELETKYRARGPDHSISSEAMLLKGLNAQLQEEVAQIKAGVALMDTENRLLQDECERLQRDVAALKSENTFLKLDNHTLVTQSSSVNLDHEAWAQERAQLKAQLATMAKDNAALGNELVEAKTSAALLQKQNAKQAKEIAGLRSTLSDAQTEQQKAETEASALRNRLRAAELDKRKNKDTSKLLEEQISELRQQLESSGLERGYKQLFQQLFFRDVAYFEAFFKAFDKIADEALLANPRRQIELLVTSRQTLETAAPGPVHDQLLSTHRLVLDYFARAIDVIVDDHIRLLLKDNEQTTYTGEYVAELKKHIRALQEQNTKTESMSPRLKLRIEELTNRWKAEREARIYEHRQVKKRLAEMGQT